MEETTQYYFLVALHSYVKFLNKVLKEKKFILQLQYVNCKFTKESLKKQTWKKPLNITYFLVALHSYLRYCM